jgi:hypothetical protein
VIKEPVFHLSGSRGAGARLPAGGSLARRLEEEEKEALAQKAVIELLLAAGTGGRCRRRRSWSQDADHRMRVRRSPFTMQGMLWGSDVHHDENVRALPADGRVHIEDLHCRICDRFHLGALENKTSETTRKMPTTETLPT